MKKIMLALFLGLATFSLAACGGGGVDYPVEYFNATVTGSEASGSAQVFSINTTGFYDMTVEVTVDAGTITAYDVISHEESADYGGLLIDDTNYIDDLVASNAELSGAELDAYAGATATRDALMDAALAALEHYTAFYE